MYSRFQALEKYGKHERQQLENSTVAIVGLGATGSVIAENLARHGVKLKIIDRDYLEENDVYSSNIYTPEQSEKSLPKAEAARDYLQQFTEVEARVESLKSENISMLEDADIILDGTDNLATRFLISEYSQKKDVPWIYTAVIAEKGYSMFFQEKCFNCIFDKVSTGKLETCETAGVMREISGQAALKSSLKAVEYLAGQKVEEKLEIVHRGETLDVESSGCPVCRGEKYSHLEQKTSTTAVCGENKYQVEIEMQEGLEEKLGELGEIKADNKYLIRAQVNGKEFTLFKDGRVILRARDRGHAESLVSEVLGI